MKRLSVFAIALSFFVAACGIGGLKPTRGVLSMRGVVPSQRKSPNLER